MRKKVINSQHLKINNQSSFTLIELLIVIGILAVLAVVVILVINPSEFLKQSRDSSRMTELQELNKAIAHYQSDGGTNLGLTNKVYVSIPSFYSDCFDLDLPSLPSNWFYACSNSDNYRKVNGTGWVPVPFTSISFGSTLEKLPIDPVNTTSTGNYYTYVVGGSWKLTSSFESEKYAKKMNTDGGTDPALFETGSNLSLLNTGRGLVGYWKFDEGSGTTASDSSGNGNTGTLYYGPTWTTGEVGSTLSFDGVNDYVNVLNSASLSLNGDEASILMWVNPASVGYNAHLWRKYVSGNGYFGGYYSNGKMRCYFYQTTGGADTGNSSIALPLNQWTHIAVTFKRNDSIKLYINANLDKNVLTSDYPLYNTGGNLLIGYAGWVGVSDAYFNGLIDEVRIYNRALSAAEIKVIYDATK